MNYKKEYSTWVEIDLIAIEENVRQVRQLTGVSVMAVVKANGYGHGAVPSAQAALRGGASWFGVARIGEALELRNAGLDNKILLLGYTPPERLSDAIAKGISITVWNSQQVELASQAAKRIGTEALLHLKVDTGMSRLGVQPEKAVRLALEIEEKTWVAFEGLFTHFACADELDKTPTEDQEAQFRSVLDDLKRLKLRPAWLHASNSAASFTRPSANFDMLRLGIAMYGLHPSKDCPTPGSIRPALTWKSVLSQVKTLPAGRGISYGHEYTTETSERIGTIPLGYADGFRRTKDNRVLIGDRRVPVIGKVCMDQIMVLLDEVPSAREGDEVVVVGSQGDESISVEELALRWGTINYEVVCGISPAYNGYIPDKSTFQ
ncbi:MAG: alanine racemase [Anaerolineales bacterium]